jgi:ribosome maturation protein Sdo1
MENEFGTSDEEAVIRQIMEKGALQDYEVCSMPLRNIG